MYLLKLFVSNLLLAITLLAGVLEVSAIVVVTIIVTINALAGVFP